MGILLYLQYQIEKSYDGKKYVCLGRAESRCVVKTGGQGAWKFFPELLC